jgi:hypothetical protein
LPLRKAKKVGSLSTKTIQRTRLAAVWGFEIRQPVTEVDNCNIADVLT